MPTYTTSPTETLRLGDVVVLGAEKYTVSQCSCCDFYLLIDEKCNNAFGTTVPLDALTDIVRAKFARIAPKESPKEVPPLAVGQTWRTLGVGNPVTILPGELPGYFRTDGSCFWYRSHNRSKKMHSPGELPESNPDTLVELIDDAPATEKSPAKDEVTLVLTREEAQFLRQVTGKFVRGEGPARKFNRSIFEKLEELGFCSIKGYPISSINGIWCDKVKEPLFRLNEVWRTEKKYLVRVVKVNPGGSGFVRTIHNPKDAEKMYDSDQCIAVYANGIVTSSNDKLVEKISD